MRTSSSRLYQDDRVFFPAIARGHSSGIRKDSKGCLTVCSNAKRMHAHYNGKDEYVDGHLQDQATAERAHMEGYR